MVNTWNPADRESHITLSGGNLIATATSGWTSTVRCIDSQASGKFYYECTYNLSTQSGTGAGLYRSTVPVGTGIGSTATGTCGLVQPGGVWVDGAATITVGGVPASNINFGTIGSGTVVCIAVDLTAKLLWFRLGAGGNWNANAARNPATGVGGISIPNLGGAFPAYPVASFNGFAADQITANFGDGGVSFTGAVPAGFASGFSATATVPGGGSQARVMVLA